MRVFQDKIYSACFGHRVRCKRLEQRKIGEDTGKGCIGDTGAKCEFLPFLYTKLKRLDGVSGGNYYVRFMSDLATSVEESQHLGYMGLLSRTSCNECWQVVDSFEIQMKYYHFKLNSFNIVVLLNARRYLLQTKSHLIYRQPNKIHKVFFL